MNPLQELKDRLAMAAHGRLKDGKTCIQCNDPFTDENVYTDKGWKESQISGLCERCWNAMPQEPEEGGAG
jgi:hypothetical protein